MYHIIGTLQGQAVGIESISHPNLEALAQSLHSCAECLEMIAKEFSKECKNVETDTGVAPIGKQLLDVCGKWPP